MFQVGFEALRAVNVLGKKKRGGREQEGLEYLQHTKGL